MIWNFGLAIVTVIYMICGYFFYKKMVRKRDAQIERLLKKSNQHLANQLTLGPKRRHHRVTVDHVSCMIKLTDFENKKYQAWVNKTVEGKIEDLSVGGLKLLCEIDLPIKQRVEIEVQFDILDESFQLKGEFIRKESRFQEKWIEYGICFLDLTHADEKRLGYVVNRLDQSKRKIKMAKAT
jgi:hypothetical protein